MCCVFYVCVFYLNMFKHLNVCLGQPSFLGMAATQQASEGVTLDEFLVMILSNDVPDMC